MTDCQPTFAPPCTITLELLVAPSNNVAQDFSISDLNKWEKLTRQNRSYVHSTFMYTPLRSRCFIRLNFVAFKERKYRTGGRNGEGN